MSLDSDAEDFLKAMKQGTAETYRFGLRAFQEFYTPQGTIKDFLDRVWDDLKQSSRRDNRRVAENTLRDFALKLQAKGLSSKSIRTYVSSVQSLCRYNRIPIELRYINLPAATGSRKFPWTLDTVSKFIEDMDSLMYKAFSTVLFQSGLRISDALRLTYSDIQKEYEQNISPLCLDFGVANSKKTSAPFLTFIGQWAIKNLHAYLATQQLKTEEMLFPIPHRSIVDSYFRRRAKIFLGKWEGRCPARPQSLRSAFRTLLGDSQKIAEKDIEFFMSHDIKGDIRKIYTEKSIEGWRQTYLQIEPFLTPTFNLQPPAATVAATESTS